MLGRNCPVLLSIVSMFMYGRVQWKWYETYKYHKNASYHLFYYVKFNSKNNLEKAFFDWRTSRFPNLGFYVPHFSWNLWKSRNCNFVSFLATKFFLPKNNHKYHFSGDWSHKKCSLFRNKWIMNTVLFYIFIEFLNILVFTIVCSKIRPRLMNVLNLGIISLCWSLDVMNPFLSRN